MNKEKRRVPKLRFPGFTEDWEQRKLGEVVKSYSGGTPTASNKEYYGGDIPFIRSAEINSDTTELYITQKGLDNSSAKIVEKGTILYAMYGATSGEVGISKINGAINQAILAMIPLEYNSKIIAQYLRKNKESIIGKYLQGGQGNLSANIILELLIQLPGLEESNQIANFLESFDNLITLHQRKLEHLNLKKKALLQKLFPKNGERHPELRFPGFTDAWEQRKLGDFYTFKNGLNKEKVYFGYGDSIVNFTDVFHNRQIYSSTLKGKVCVNKKELENYKVKEGDLFFTRTSETIDEIGFPAVVMEPMERVVFSGFVLRGRAEKNDPLVNIFKSYIFFTDNFRSEMKKKSSMTTRALTSGTALKEMYFSYPKDLEEQTKIGEILLRLDNIITLHQRKLEHLQLQKKALLQQMFV